MDKHILRDARDSIANLGSNNNRFAGKTIILTGAGGFLGAQFCHYFTALNDEGGLPSPCRLIAYDSLIRGEPSWLASLSSRDDVDLHRADVTKFTDYPPADFVI